jgi:methylated-DNA-protein-cysteine methyltransferase-like protein
MANVSSKGFMLSQENLWKVTSYGIAKALGTARSARVGWAMNASHNREMFPHRVVNRNGLLTGKFHFDGTNLMQQF